MTLMEGTVASRLALPTGFVEVIKLLLFPVQSFLSDTLLFELFEYSGLV